MVLKITARSLKYYTPYSAFGSSKALFPYYNSVASHGVPSPVLEVVKKGFVS